MAVKSVCDLCETEATRETDSSRDPDGWSVESVNSKRYRMCPDCTSSHQDMQTTIKNVDQAIKAQWVEHRKGESK